MTDVVTNVSFAFKWAVAEHDSADADAMLLAWRQRDVRVVVPCWFACELANALHQKVRSGTIRTVEATQYVRVVLELVTILDPHPEIAVRGLEIAARLGQRASYDAQYVALAERLGCELWTADRRFGHAAQAAFPFVHWLGEPV